jgi:hypothetical protein
VALHLDGYPHTAYEVIKHKHWVMGRALTIRVANSGLIQPLNDCGLRSASAQLSGKEAVTWKIRTVQVT